jgi:hypothetical protein
MKTMAIKAFNLMLSTFYRSRLRNSFKLRTFYEILNATLRGFEEVFAHPINTVMGASKETTQRDDQPSSQRPQTAPT